MDTKKIIIPIILISLFSFLLISYSGASQEEDETPVPSIPLSLYLTSSNGLSTSPSDSGSIPIPDMRLITGGGSRSLGEWTSDPVIGPTVVGGSMDLQLLVRGTFRDFSISASFNINDDEVGYDETRSMNQVSGSVVIDLSASIPDTVLEEGDKVSVSLDVSASMTRNVDIALGNPSSPAKLTFDTDEPDMTFEAHLHGELHMVLSMVPAWGESWITGASATIGEGEESLVLDATSSELTEGILYFEWEVEEVPSGEPPVTLEIQDSSGNIFTVEGEIHADAHDHSHGEIEVTPGNLMLLSGVILGLVAVGYVGGITPLHSFFDERKMRYLLAFSGGVFIATAVFHALPEAIHMSGWWISIPFVLLGFGTLYVIEHYVIDLIDKKFRKKKKGHDHKHEGVKLHLHDHHSPDHSIETDGDLNCEAEVCTHHMNQTSEAAFLGVSLHNLLEGIVIATLFLNPNTQGIGFIVIFATILHKAPCTFSIASLLKIGGHSAKSIKKLVLIVLGMTPIGAILAVAVFIKLDMIFVGMALAFSAGTFLEIGLLDLIPESVKEKKGRGWALFAIALGLVILWGFSLFHGH